MLVYGMGELHIEIILDRLEREFGLKVNRGEPQVSYRECVTEEATSKYEFERLIGTENHHAVVEGEGRGRPFRQKRNSK